MLTNVHAALRCYMVTTQSLRRVICKEGLKFTHLHTLRHPVGKVTEGSMQLEALARVSYGCKKESASLRHVHKHVVYKKCSLEKPRRFAAKKHMALLSTTKVVYKKPT